MNPEPEKNKHEDGKPYAYVPRDAKVNNDNQEMEPPEVIYEDRLLIYRKEQIEKIIGGKRIIDEQDH
jgi:hypothetical protein